MLVLPQLHKGNATVPHIEDDMHIVIYFNTIYTMMRNDTIMMRNDTNDTISKQQ